MRDHDGCVRGFYRSSKAWYAMDERDIDVMFGMYHPDGGTTGEMSMRWHDLGPGRLVPRLEVFCDAWDALQEFTDVLAVLAEHDSEDITEEEFVSILQAHDVQDLTKYESPYPNTKADSLRNRLMELEEEKREIEEQLGI